MNNPMPTQKANNEISDCECEPKCTCRSTPKGRQHGAFLIIFVVVTWIMGMIIAKGFWSSLFSYICPPWAWYLLIERAMLLLLGPAWL